MWPGRRLVRTFTWRSAVNVSDLIDTVEAKVGLLADQRENDSRAEVGRQIASHLAEMRTALGLPIDEQCCNDCGCYMLEKCIDCGHQYCDDCLSEDGLCRECEAVRDEADEPGEAAHATPPQVKTIHAPPPGPEQVARLRALFTETGNRTGIEILQDYEDRIEATGGWDAHAM